MSGSIDEIKRNNATSIQDILPRQSKKIADIHTNAMNSRYNPKRIIRKSK